MFWFEGWWSENICFPGSSDSKESACNEGDLGPIPGLGRSPGEGNGNLLQHSCLENSVDRRAWLATVHGVTKSWTQLSDWAIWQRLQTNQDLTGSLTRFSVRSHMSVSCTFFPENYRVYFWSITSPRRWRVSVYMYMFIHIFTCPMEGDVLWKPPSKQMNGPDHQCDVLTSLLPFTSFHRSKRSKVIEFHTFHCAFICLCWSVPWWKINLIGAGILSILRASAPDA